MRDYANTADKEIIAVLAGCIGYAGMWRCAVGQQGMPVSGMTHLSLFSGIGGLDLAAEWAGFKTVGQCEFADYPTKVLENHWPNVPKWRDIHDLSGNACLLYTSPSPRD